MLNSNKNGRSFENSRNEILENPYITYKIAKGFVSKSIYSLRDVDLPGLKNQMFY